MLSPQLTDAALLKEELMMRNFTKRQRSVLDFIYRLSWCCGKKVAIIPMLKDFALVGIDQTKIKAEIACLITEKVIIRDESGTKYFFNENFNDWGVSVVQSYNGDRYQELINLNCGLAEKASGEGNGLAKTASELAEKASGEGNGLAKTASELAEKASGEGTNLPKQQVKQGDNNNNNNYNNNKIISIMSQEESQYISVLEKIPLYPIDREKDLSYYHELEQRYPKIDLLEMIKDWESYKLDKPLKKNDNPRSQINTQCKLCIKWNKCLKQNSRDKPPTKPPGFKPPQAGNFEQRKHTDDYFDNVYKEV